jgi:hypothetical protein
MFSACPAIENVSDKKYLVSVMSTFFVRVGRSVTITPQINRTFRRDLSVDTSQCRQTSALGGNMEHQRKQQERRRHHGQGCRHGEGELYTFFVFTVKQTDQSSCKEQHDVAGQSWVPSTRATTTRVKGVTDKIGSIAMGPLQCVPFAAFGNNTSCSSLRNAPSSP